MKKGLSLFFSLIFAVGICLSASFVVEANAASTSDLTFKLSEDGTGYEITDCKKTASGTLTIPDTYNGKPVVGIAGDAFTDCSSISVLKLSKNIEYSNDGFWGCSFKEVYIPDLKKWCSIELGTEAGIPLTPLRYAEKIFVNGKLFTELNISPSDNITTINKFAFHCAKNLKKVNISGSVTKIDDFAFTYCPELATVVIGDSLEELGGGAFYDCAKLTSVKLPNKPLNIGHSYIGQEMGIKSVFSSTPIESAAYNSGEQCFYVDNHMISIFPDKSNGSLKIKEGTLDIPKLDFLYSDYGLDIISSVEIPGSVKEIPANAFNGIKLESLYLGEGIERIGAYAFANTDIYSLEIPASVEYIGGAAFTGCENLRYVTIPSTVKDLAPYSFGFVDIYQRDFDFYIYGETGSAAEEYAYVNGFDFVATNEKVSINDLEFTLNSDGKSYSVTGYDRDIAGALVIPSTYNGKPVIGVCPIIGENNIFSITIPDSVVSWEGAWNNYKGNLKEVVVGNGLTKCPSFFECQGLQVVSLGTGIKDFSIRQFDWCVNLKEINIASGNPNYTSVDGVVFNKNKTTLLGYPKAKNATTYTVPSTVTTISEMAFAEADRLLTVNIPGNVKTIGEGAFFSCVELQNVVISNGTTTIKNWAFADCENLKQITIPASVTSIGEYSLGYMNRATDTSPDEVWKIEDFTIYGAAGSAAEEYADNNGFKFVASLQSVPAAPTVKIANTSDGINVTWNAVSSATSYTVYRKTYNASTEAWSGWSNLATGYTSTAYLDKTVKLGTKYKYTVRAVNSSGAGSFVETSELQYNVAPTVKATNTNSGVTVTWNKINSATSYNVYRSAYDASAGTWSKWASLKKGVTSTSYNDTLGNLGVTYKYTVRAVLGDFAGKFVDSNSIKCAPVPKTTIANTASGVKVSWTNVFGATSYKVFRRELNTTNNTWSAWSSPASGVTGNAYVDKTVKLGTTYSYAVVAVNSSASSSFTASNSLKCDLTTTVTATNTNSGMKLTWNKVNGATGYTIYRKALNATNNTWSSWSVLKTGYTSTSYTDTLGNLGVSYIYCVRATVGSFSGRYVQSEAVQSNIAPKVTVKNASNGIQVSWNGILGSDSYTVYRRVYNASTQKWGSWTALVRGNKSTGYVDTLGNLGATYSYTVRAVKGDFASSYVASVSIDCTPIVKASISNTSTGVKITWNNVFGATSYKVFRRELNTTNNTWSGWTSVTSGITGSAYTDKTAKLGATYSYAVVAVNGSASSNYVATSGLKCDIPVTVKATSTTSGINLTWNKVNGATGYTIYRKAYNTTNNTWSSWSTLKTGYTGTSYNDTIGNLGVSYIYCVRATVGSYSGSYVQSAQVKCNISPKTTIANTTNGIKISWSNVFGATSYKIFRRELNTTNNTWGSWSVIASGVTGSACIDKTAKLGVTYSYAVVAVNSTASSSYIAAPGLKCDITTTVTATSTSSGINLKWNAVNGATGYTIYRKALNSTNNTWSAWSVLKTGYTSTSYNDTLGNLGVSYIYCVRATVGNYSGSYVQSAQVKCNIAPKTTAANTTDGIKVTWGNVFGATSYKVFRRELNTTNNTWSAWSSLASGLTGSAYVDKTAIFGATYTYAVVAVNNTASSGYIATPAIQCGTVPKVTIGVASNGIRVNWNAISGAESYVVYKKIYNPITETWSAWTTVTQNYKGTTVVDTDVNKDTYYVYTVRASKGNFNGSFAQSNVVKYTK